MFSNTVMQLYLAILLIAADGGGGGGGIGRCHTTPAVGAGVEETAEVKREGTSKLQHEEHNKQLHGYIYSVQV